MTDYEDFLPHVMPYVQNCFEEVAVTAVRNTVIDFCRQTLVLQQDIYPITLIANVAEYDLVADPGLVPHQIFGLYYNGYEILRASQLAVNQHGGGNWQQMAGAPKWFTQFRTDTIIFAPKPTETELSAVTGRMAVVPSRESTEVDDMLFETYLDPIVNGTLSRLAATPNQPYSDPAAAISYGALYRNACAKTRAFVNGGLSQAPLRVKMQSRS